MSALHRSCLFVAVVVALTLSLVGMSGATLAQSTSSGDRSIVIVNVAEDTRVHGIIARDIYKAVQRTRGYTVKDLHGPLNAGGEVESQNNIRAAAAFYETGMKAFEAGEFEEAADQLDNAASMMARDLAILPDMSMYKRALLALGASWVALGENEDATDAFMKAVLARAPVDSLDLTEEAIQKRQEVELKVNEADLGAVVIESLPDHVEVHIDGRYRGITPITVAGLVMGEHILSVSKPGFSRRTKTIFVSAERMGQESIELEPARRKPQYEQLVERIRVELGEAGTQESIGGPGIQSIGTLLYGELALIVDVDGPAIAKRISLSLFDTQSQKRLNEVTREADLTRRNKKVVSEMVDELLNIDFGEAHGGAGAADFAEVKALGRQPQVWETWWFWTIIGSVVAGGVTAGLVLGLSPDDSGPAPTGGTISVQF